MKRWHLYLGVGIAVALFFVLLAVLSRGALPLLFPAGSIGAAERDLMVRAVLLMLIVVVPVVVLAIFIGWHYRASNTKATYTPDWERSKMEEFIWWTVPFEIVLVLAALTWTSTHELDPGKALAVSAPPLTVQVVALPWKWLFIYPEQGIASVNELALPVDRPVKFAITADAPMNSFWIPALGGQMYAMSGMTTTLHLMATKLGDYPGRSANYSGDGFAQMQFTAHVVDEKGFAAWIVQAKASPDTLSPEEYEYLSHPSPAGPVRYYGSVGMPFTRIVTESMGPTLPTGHHHH